MPIAVVHYLAVERSIPLRSIRELGVGSDFPDANNKTREDRKENRRVDVKIYSLDVSGTPGTSLQQLPGYAPGSVTSSLADRTCNRGAGERPDLWRCSSALLAFIEGPGEGRGLAEASGQILCQHFRSRRQALGARKVRASGGLRLLHDIPDLLD